MIFPSEKTIEESYVPDYEKLYAQVKEDPEAFWANIAKELSWFKLWNKVLTWNYPYARWFVGGQTNIVYNALDRYQKTPIADKLAYVWEGQDGTVRKYTYRQLNEEVCRLANGLKSLGLKKGDKVSIYLPRIMEQIIAMLACAKIGLVHSVVFSGFSIEALKNRIIDAEAKAVICADGYPYKDKVIECKKNVDEAIKDLPQVKHVIIAKRANNQIVINNDRDIWWDELIIKQDTICSTEIMEATDPLFILYTSGCSHKDTLIQLSSGEIKRIEDLVKQKGTKITNINLKNLDQENDEITAKHHYQEQSYLVKITTSISSGLFTSNHPFFILQSNGEIVEKEAGSLQKGDHIMMARRIDIKGQKQLLPQYNIIYHEEKCSKNLPNKPRLPQYLSRELAELLGVLLGDGSLKSDTIEITDKDKLNLLYDKKLFDGLNLRSVIVKKDRQRILVHSKYLANYLKQAFPEVFTSSHFRDIPILIQKSDDNTVSAFVRGLYDAEGSVVLKSPSVKISSTSQQLIKKLQFLLLRFSIISSYRYELRKTHFDKKQYITQVYELRITDREALNLFAKEIGFSSTAKRLKLQKLLKQLKRKRIASMIYLLPINSLLKQIRQTIRLRKKNSCKVFLESYEYTERRITAGHLPRIYHYLKQIINELKALNTSDINSIRKIIYLLRIHEKALAEISGKSIHTVHKYIHANKPDTAKNTLVTFYRTINSYLETVKKDKEQLLSEILYRIETLSKLKNVGFFEVKKISLEKNDADFDSVYDITTQNNHNYIANSFIVHNSTGKPKGVVHNHGGYQVGTYLTLKWVFDIRPDDIWFCTADAGWITGHSYIVYGPLLNGITTFVYESVPDYPDQGKWWSLVEKYKVTKFYTAPTAIRSLMRYGNEWPKKYDLSSLKILGSVGEPINPEAWLWYYKTIGREQCPLIDTWWQTETGMFMLTPLPSSPLKPGSCNKPFFGIEADVVDAGGQPVPVDTQGYLVIKTPWPSMLMDVYKNPKKYLETYFENEALNINKNNEAKISVANAQEPTSPQAGGRVSNFLYFTGDSAKKDKDGYFWIVGRNDDVIKVSGHRLGSAELESAFVAHPAVAEAAVIGKPHEIKGESIKAFVILKHGQQPTDTLKEELKKQVRTLIGPIATPDEIVFVDKLPKTRSGKIMRRVLKAQELGQPLGDTSTLEQ